MFMVTKQYLHCLCHQAKCYGTMFRCRPCVTSVCVCVSAADGQHIYLHSLNARCLTAQYGSLQHSPDTITAVIVQTDALSMTEVGLRWPNGAGGYRSTEVVHWGGRDRGQGFVIYDWWFSFTNFLDKLFNFWGNLKIEEITNSVL